MNATNAPMHELEMVLRKFLELYTGRTMSEVKCGKHLMGMINTGRLDNEFLSSYDALYLSFVFQKGAELLEENLY